MSENEKGSRQIMLRARVATLLDRHRSEVTVVQKNGKSRPLSGSEKIEYLIGYWEKRNGKE